MLRTSIFGCAAALVLAAAPLAAQATNSTLTLTYDAMASELTADLSAAPADAMTLAAVGRTLGTTMFSRSGLTLGLDRPFFVMPLGRTDANGDLSRTFSRLPARQMAGDTLHFQAITVEVMRATTPTPPTRGNRWPRGNRTPPTITFTTSNVASQTF